MFDLGILMHENECIGFESMEGRWYMNARYFKCMQGVWINAQVCLNICVGAWNALIFDLLYFDMCLNELLIDITQKFGMFFMVVECWCMMEATIGGWETPTLSWHGTCVCLARLVDHQPCHAWLRSVFFFMLIYDSLSWFECEFFVLYNWFIFFVLSIVKQKNGSS